jgi:hypothetical protein
VAKFGRRYQLIVQTNDGLTITIENPFTIEFDITRNNFSSANTATFRIFNLGQTVRNRILKNQNDIGNLKTVVFKAGYGENIPTLLYGNVVEAFSVREGVNFITEIRAFDGGAAYGNAKTNRQFGPGVSYREIIQSVISDLAPFGITPGAIGSFPGNTTSIRGTSYSGVTIDILSRDLVPGAFFIDNGKANCLNQDEYIDGQTFIITSATGLLGTPIREASFLNIDILFEPQLFVGQLVKLDSSTGANYNSTYKVISLKHRGMISDAVCGNAVTSVGVLAGTYTPVVQESA